MKDILTLILGLTIALLFVWILDGGIFRLINNESEEGRDAT